VITWFQNRRAKLKRDLDELRADVTAARRALYYTSSLRHHWRHRITWPTTVTTSV